MNTYEMFRLCGVHNDICDELIYVCCLNFVRMVCLLDDAYDTGHRAYMMREKGMVIMSNLNILQICL